MIIGIYLFIPPLASFLHTVVSKGCRVWVHVVMSLLLVWVFLLRGKDVEPMPEELEPSGNDDPEPIDLQPIEENIETIDDTRYSE